MIIYLIYDDSAPEKQKKSLELVDNALTSGKGVISYQVIQEFLNVSTRKFRVPLTLLDAKTYLVEVMMPLCGLYAIPELFHEALDIQGQTQFSFYDALIVAASIRIGCDVLYSEGLQNKRRIGKLLITNPFMDLI